MIDLDELERRSQCALWFQRYEEAALIAAVRAAIEQVESDDETTSATLSDDLNSPEAEAAFQRGHDANKALLAALAPFRKEPTDD